jgi:hypothetical protein
LGFDIFDGTANQVFQIWFQVAVTYYDNEYLAFWVNAIHFPWHLESNEMGGE